MDADAMTKLCRELQDMPSVPVVDKSSSPKRKRSKGSSTASKKSSHGEDEVIDACLSLRVSES